MDKLPGSGDNPNDEHAPSPPPKFWRRFLRDLEITDFIMAAATVMIAIETGFYVHYARQQWVTMNTTLSEVKSSGQDATTQANRAIANLNWLARSMHESVKASQDTMQASEKQSRDALDANIAASRTDQRAWIGVIESGLAPGVPRNLDEGTTPIFYVMITNSGKTPALEITVKNKHEFLSHGKIPHPTEEFRSLNRPVNEGVIQPGGKRIMWIPIGGLITKDQADRLRSHASVFYIFGLITYRDIFAQRHWTKFCVSLQASQPISFVECSEYNDAD